MGKTKTGPRRKWSPPIISQDGITADIELTNGKFATIDIADIPLIGSKLWFAHLHPNGKWYAMQGSRVPGMSRQRYMHRVIMGVTDPHIGVDHKVQELTLLNTRENMRIATRTQNAYNVSKKSNNTTGFIGVHWQTGGGFFARIKVDKKIIHLGTYPEAETAARVRDRAAIKHYGEFAVLNFPITDYD